MTSRKEEKAIKSISHVTLPTNKYIVWAIGMLISIVCLLDLVHAVNPKFDPSTHMRLVLVPADAQVGSIIYRLRAIDEEFDYPLSFELIGDTASATVRIESLPCTKYNSVCQANIVLQRRLEIGRYYDFEISVRDTEGGIVNQMCSITATNFTTPHNLIFPHKPGIIMIPEDAKRGTELDYVIARKNPLSQKPVYMELWGSHLFAIRQTIVSAETTEGTIFLLGSLDFEKQAMYHLTVLANDAYAEAGQDSRNIAGLDIVVIVQDIQDEPPVFTLAAPVTKLPFGILPGDKILKVHAVDGDKGNPREVRYGLVSEGNPFTSFFDINDTSGEVFLMRPLEDIAAIANVGDPVLLTVVAEEVKVAQDEPPAMASTVQLALFLPERINSSPYFENDHYVSRVDENAPQGTALAFVDPYVPRVYDDDTDKNGVFSLSLINNNGTFEISPNVVERSTSFILRVRDNFLLNYEERHSVQLQILAQEIGPATNLSTTVTVTVYINDVNDNPPIFDQTVYIVELPENMTLGTKVVQVKAEDVDSVGSSGIVRYTAIFGYLNTSLYLDRQSGLITLATSNHGFDREIMPEYHLYIEARDDGGNGNRAQVPLIIKLLDVNDETPSFEKNLYEFILAPDLKSFTSTAIIHASDKDATRPNNEVRYEIINGNYDNQFYLEKISGELSVREKGALRKRRQSQSNRDGDIFLMTARAYDLGVPILSSTTNIRIYPPESRTRTVTFVVPGANPDRFKTEEILSAITGGRVLIRDIRLLRPGESGTESISGRNMGALESSVVTATVLYDSSSVVDISHIQQRLAESNASYVIMNGIHTSETDTLYKAENKLLFWLLILLACLVAVMIIILLLCCTCPWCPLYGAKSKKIVNTNRTKDGVHLVHTEMANGKQAKSVQVSEGMGRREAWSAEKQLNARTKPTHWEFHNRCKEFNGNVGVHSALNNEENRTYNPSAEDQRGEKIKRSIKDATFKNCRTNLINCRDVRIEDIIDEQELLNTDKENFRNRKLNLQLNQHQKLVDSEIKHIDDGSVCRSYMNHIDNNTAPRSLKTQQEIFIKDGDVEILKLMTRDKTGDGATILGSDNNIYVNTPIKSADLSNPQLRMIDNSGKEILMRRFIEEQPDGKQIIREHYHIIPGTTNIQSMPNEIQQQSNSSKSGSNSVVYSHTEPEVKVIHTQQGARIQPSTSNQSLTHELETSLKQQNELLIQILMEKGKLESRYNEQEVNLETQSLPGLSVAIGTQTECEVGTQTDEKCMQKISIKSQAKYRKRKARSENDDTMSGDEYEYVRSNPEGVYFINHKNQKICNKYRSNIQTRKHNVMVKEVKRKIRTPIEEEDFETFMYRRRTPPHKPLRRHAESIKDVLGHEKSNFGNEVYMKISDSLGDNLPSPSHGRTIRVDEDDIKTVYSKESDVDEVVLKCNPENKNEIHVTNERENKNFNKDKLLRSSSERDCLLESRLNLLSKQTLQHNKHSKRTPNILKQKSSSLKVLNRKHPAHAEKVRVYQSETDLNCQGDRPKDEVFSKKNLPKYVEWNYSKQITGNIKSSTSSTKSLTMRRRKSITTELPSKAKLCSKSDIISEDVNFKLEPENKKSSRKTNSLLKEDIKMNRQYQPKFGTETSHPLLQHSEYRFERENVPEVSLPPAKLSHYIYPKTPHISALKGVQYKKQNEDNFKIGLSVENSNSTQSISTNTHKIYQQLNASALEDDHDSGIAMNSLLTNKTRRNPIADKKSIFSIAYDDVNGVKKIASEGESPEYS